MSENTKQKYVLVTTKHRGVFAGYLEQEDGDYVVLTKCRCCIRWRNQKGFLGLAGVGPDDQCHISAEAPRTKLYDVTSVSDCSETAEKAWLAA